MIYNAINIQGNIISSEILEKIRTEDIKYQGSADFKLDRHTAVRDEIGIAWAAARAHWQAFQIRRDRLKDNDTGTSETRQSWMIPFLRELGYELDKSTTEIINNKSYAISHRAANRDGFPVHIIGINQSLDQRAESGGTRISPHALVQEYLNNHDHLYAFVTNGKFLRLLRDATRLSRLSYLEFNLEQIMDEDLFSEFAVLFRVLHITRMPEKVDSGEESYFEYYHQEGLASGSRIREKLSKAVEQSLKILANGLLKHPSNEELRLHIREGNLKSDIYYLHLLRLVYRMLFLLVIEERKLIYPEKRDEATNKKRDVYYKYYSIGRLAKLAEKQIYVDPRKSDLWQSLKALFLLFENGYYSEKLNIKPLGSGLFAPDAIGNLVNMSLDNGTLLKVLNLLVRFDNENNQRIRVNYADLDVEEFGSVYEGLLEYDAVFNEINGQPEFAFIKGDDRSSSGSHYTPEELVKPLLQHSLEYLIQDCINKPEERLGLNNPDAEQSRTTGLTKQQLQEKALLSLKVLDDACGSGHILLSAARRIGLELARVRTNEDQPAPPVIRQATRDAIRYCIYGVDLNPLAVELCKVALWLEAHNPGEPLNFLDHHIKCGNAIVGLAHKEELKNGIADEAFKTLPGDEKEIAQSYSKRNKAERKISEQNLVQLDAFFQNVVEEPLSGIMATWEQVNQMPENTPVEIDAKQRAYNNLISGPKWWKLKAIADMQVAQFFIPKTTNNKDSLVTDADYRQYLTGHKTLQDRAAAKAVAVSLEKHFFHWFLEFPEIFAAGGFDCNVGNPPYLGGSKISGFYGNDFLNYIKIYFHPAVGLTDLIAYFFRRNYSLIRKDSFMSLITTNSVYQGDSRESSLDIIYNQEGKINFAIRSIKWPGEAKLMVSLINIVKGNRSVQCSLDGKEVNYISQYLDTSVSNKPNALISNKGICFIGSSFLGTGFIITKEEYLKIRDCDCNNQILFPAYNGDDLNNEVSLSDKYYAIYFADWSYEKASKFSNLLKILEERVLPERKQSKQTQYIEQFWKFKRPTTELYNRIENSECHYVTSLTTRFLNFTKMKGKNIYSHAIGIVVPNHPCQYTFIQSTLHTDWAVKEGSSLANTIRYTPSDCFETFPFPQNVTHEQSNKLEQIGETYNEFRKQLMLKIQLGLTKTYNLFHSPKLTATSPQDMEMDDKSFEKKFGKDAALLRKHLAKTEGTCPFNEAVEGIIKLRELHVEMDNAVLEAYGWSDVQLRHDFYKVDYLPENDRERYTIHPDARKEILKRLLELNHKIHEEEVKEGLWEKKKPKQYKTKKTKSSELQEPEAGYGDLFNQ